MGAESNHIPILIIKFILVFYAPIIFIISYYLPIFYNFLIWQEIKIQEDYRLAKR